MPQSSSFTVTLPRTFRLLIHYLLGPALFIFISLSIYRQLAGQADLAERMSHLRSLLATPSRLWMLAAALLLVIPNWLIESVKWRNLASHVQPLSMGKAIRSVMAGVSFTMLTPNRMGEFLGRVLYLPEESRFRTATLTLLGSLSQIIITLAAGWAGLMFLRFTPPETANTVLTPVVLNALIGGTTLILIAIGLLFFNVGWLVRIVEKIPPISRYAEYIHHIGDIHSRELNRLLGLSALRYGVFLAQYLLVFSYFEVDMLPVQLMAATAVMFLLLTAVPTIALAELGIRGQVSLFVFGMYSTMGLEILIATSVIWLINIILPAVAGSFLLLSIKVFRKT